MPTTGIDNISFISETPYSQTAYGSCEPMPRNRSLPFGKSLLIGLGIVPLSLIPMSLAPVGQIPAGAILGVVPGVAPWGLGQFDMSAHAQARDPIVTSDSPEYCGVLMDRISGITRTTATPPPTEAAVLSEEGERMCVHGQTRGGILRLRRALEIMRHGED